MRIPMNETIEDASKVHRVDVKSVQTASWPSRRGRSIGEFSVDGNIYVAIHGASNETIWV